MNAARLFLLMLLTAATMQACHAQPDHWTDLAESGYRGPVQMVKAWNYRAIRDRKGDWQPNVADSPAYRKWTYFNADGFADSVITRRTIPGSRPDTLVTRSISTFDRQGARTGYRFYQAGSLEEVCRLTWVDNYTYTDSVVGVDGQLRSVTQNFLNKDFSLNRTHMIIWRSDTVWIDETDRWERDTAGYAIRSVRRDAVSGEVSASLYRPARLDAHRNPLEVLIRYEDSEGIPVVVRREIAYRK